MIQRVGPQFTQWDVGRSVTVSDSDATHIHFANQGDSQAVIIAITEGTAKVPDYLFQTGKALLAYAVKDGITLECVSFSVRKRERPENYVYEEDRRNYIYELIAEAEEAISSANQAAANATEKANWAEMVAIESAKTADDAAITANNAALEATNSARTADDAAETAYQAASKAVETANQAASKAAHTAKSLMVVGKTEGASIPLDDAIDQFLVGCRIFGKTTQDGTPTTDAPVDLVSVGDSGSIAVNVTGDNDAQNMTIATPNGLPGIKVTSGGNYTDANGQQWICDEVDLARGVYVQRINSLNLNGSELWLEYKYEPQYYGFFVENLLDSGQNRASGLCNQFSVGRLADDSVWIGVSNNKALYVITREWYNKGISAWKSYLSTNPLRVIYPLSVPAETPLSEEELAAYAALHTYRGNTTVSNDAGAWMDIEYVMDAKKYIDSQITAGILEATVE